MAENQNSDPLVRTLLITLLGIVVFGLLLSVFNGNGFSLNGTFGGGRVMDGGHMGYGYGAYGGYGASFGGVIGGLLVLLVKLLMVVLILAVVVGIVMWVKNNFFPNTTGKSSGLMQSVNNDPILKTVATLTLAILGIMLLLAVFGSFTQPGYGFGVNFNGRMGGYNYGFNPSYSMASLLSLVINVLTFVVVVSLILAVVAYLKNQYDNNNLNLAGFGVKNKTAAAPIDANNNGNMETTE